MGLVMRVLHIMSGFGGGISSFILNKAKYFQNKDVIFDVMTFDEVSAEFRTFIEGTGGKIIKISNPKVTSFKVYFNEVNAYMKQLPKDTFVHSHMNGYRAIPFYLIAKKNGLKRFGVHMHSTGLPDEINSPKNKMIRAINNRIAQEKISCGVKASEYLFGEKSVRNKEIMHIPNSIDPTAFLQDNPVTKEDIVGAENKDKLLIGHIGRFKSVKNHDFMLEVIEEMAKQSKNFMWIFAGDGEDLDKVKASAKEKNLNDYVLFLGRRNDIPDLLTVMDYFVLPSFYEGFPTVAVEAQAAGTQTILSDTVTQEADLNLGLVKFLPITDAQKWASYMLAQAPQTDISKETRLDRLKQKKLTNTESAQLYLDFLKQRISHYEMD